jgi:hypothetical protein
MARKVLVIGQQPARQWMPGYVVKNGTLRRLFSWMSACDVKSFSFLNLMQEIDQRAPERADYDAVAFSWSYMLGNGGVRVIALGGKASAALTRLGIHHFKLPHPSGRNRQLNDKRFEANILQRCKDYIHAR